MRAERGLTRMHISNTSDFWFGALLLVGGLYSIGLGVSELVRPPTKPGYFRSDSWRYLLIGLYWIFLGLHVGLGSVSAPVHPSARLEVLRSGSEIAAFAASGAWAVLSVKRWFDWRQARAAREG